MGIIEEQDCKILSFISSFGATTHGQTLLSQALKPFCKQSRLFALKQFKLHISRESLTNITTLFDWEYFAMIRMILLKIDILSFSPKVSPSLSWSWFPRSISILPFIIALRNKLRVSLFRERKRANDRALNMPFALLSPPVAFRLSNCPQVITSISHWHLSVTGRRTGVLARY